MNRILVPFLFSMLGGQVLAQPIEVTNLTCEYKKNPLGITVAAPGLGWQLSAAPGVRAARNINQTAYRILVADDPTLLRKNIGDIWDSQKVRSEQSIQVGFKGVPLKPARVYYWKAMVWDNKGNASEWSEPASWQMGLMTPADWHGARWIAYESLPNSMLTLPGWSPDGEKAREAVKEVLPLMRKRFTVEKKVRRATMYVCGLGQFELRLNGKKMGDHFLDPGWTRYDKHALYVGFDLTTALRQGVNSVGVMLGNGFYYIPGARYHKLSAAFGYPKMICRLAIEYADGSAADIVSDTTWRTAPGPVIYSSIYGGEDYDARLEQAGWDQPFFADKSWKAALLVTGPLELDAQLQEPLKIFERFTPNKITQPKPGVWVYALGQNASGIPWIGVKGKRGSVVKITPAELTGEDGLAMQKAIGEPVYFLYTLRGVGTENWQPQFMYYGFRYLQIEGAVPTGEVNAAGLPVIEELQGSHTRNAASRTGRFFCSDTLFNRTFSLIDWAIQSNTASVFTDCPHREKLGWLEEAHLVGPSIRYNYDIATLIRKVVRDMMKSQTAEGLVPDIAPEYTEFEGGFRDSPEWGSSAILLPWDAWQWYGDQRTLAESYPMMTRYADYLEKKASGHLLYFGLGDWYDIGPKPPGESQLTPRGLTATAIYYYDLTLLQQMAVLLGKDSDASRFARLAGEVWKAFNSAFFHPETKQYGTGSQAANAMAVYMGLVDSADKPNVIDNIIADIRDHHNGLTAGDIGFRYLLRVLDEAGRSDVIVDMNSRTDVPGYGYQLARGATALTESWQAYRDASNNHFMLGHLMEWFYSGLGGIRPAARSVAFHEIEIRPETVGNIDSASASYLSPYGLISSRWKKSSRGFALTVHIPVNTRATIYFPAEAESKVFESGRSVSGNKDIEFVGYSEGRMRYRIGSGDYSFATTGR